ncbi:FAD/NAD(P)-binding domain-containing protein [Aspergillus violaceofuscus CBS 115571]|uniref:FAD/NAD(P)-binding domain-containing protein n=1 Tax=Aspergillus violaceofuscus (strain CBS 115571) TaxID=1450538 RepID=A0A2V5HL08_ASPV1|nr:FAD/NAD(P)-binding domain-containing protein [Aspergillus violaceofuscus CBS 115571]
MSTGLFPFVGLPLPRISPKPKAITRDDRFEVIVIGAGPAGLMMTFLLARYGLTAESVPCIDAKANRRSSLARTTTPSSRYPHVVTIHQGKVEQILEAGLLQYYATGVQRRSRLVDAYIDSAGDVEFPVVAKVERDGVVKTLRSKYLVGADGAHSAVRRAVGLELEGNGPDEVWGALDLVVDTDFPDIRRRSLIRSRHGTVFVIPRERNASGEYLTRLYVRMPYELCGFEYAGECGLSLRDRTNSNAIFEQACRVLGPFHLGLRGAVEWWSCYQIRQRILKQYVVSDADDIGRIFLVGDGMNVSMMDAYNLGWKLAYSIMGLTPVSLDSLQQDEILKSYHCERFPIAQQLIEFDRQYAAKFAAAKEMSLCEDRSTSGVNSILGCRRRINAFSSGCGIEYSESILTTKAGQAISFSGSCLLALTPGTRLPNVRLKRYADGEYCDLHDEMISNGRFRVLCLASSDFLSSDGVSARALHWIGEALLPHFPGDVIEQFVIYPSEQCPRDWSCLPSSVKCHSEMRLYDGSAVQDAYEQFGVDIHHGALVILRPDGHIGMIASLEGHAVLDDYFTSCLRRRCE